MAQVDIADTAPFAGWESLRSVLTMLGPERVLRTLMLRVHNEMRVMDGTFHGASGHNYVNHPVIVRAAIKLASDSSIPLDRLAHPLSAEEEETLRRQLIQLNELARAPLRARRPEDFDRVPRFSPAHIDRVADILWFETLCSRGRANSFKHELGRTWLLLRTYWEELKGDVKGAVDVALHGPLDSAFDSLECAIALTVALSRYGGWLPDARAAFAETSFARFLEPVLGWYADDAAATVGEWSDIELFSRRGLDTVFQDRPLVRVGAAGLLAPDLAMSLAGIADRLLSRSLTNYGANGDKALESARTILGLVFERHVQALAEDCARSSDLSRFEPEFVLDDQTRSPDAFLINGRTCCAFEAKATRFPSPIHAHIEVASFMQWLREVSGERTPKRRPLEQGTRFLAKWQGDDATAVAKLGAFNGLQSLWYVIVAHEDLPPFVHWEHFRNLRWRPLLGEKERALDGRTLFISIRDLEALVGALNWLRDAGRASDAYSILSDWRTVWTRDQDIAEAPGVKPSLRGYVLERFPLCAGAMPKTLAAAVDECWAAVHESVFDSPPD
jgi:hypothetical protein